MKKRNICLTITHIRSHVTFGNNLREAKAKKVRFYFVTLKWHRSTCYLNWAILIGDPVDVTTLLLISHMPITKLENDSKSIWVKVFVNKTSHFVASWYRSPGSTSEEFHLFREQLDYRRTHHKGKKLPSVHVLGDFNFKDIDWPDRLSKSDSVLRQLEGQILIDNMNDHGLEQLVHFPTRDKNILDLILTTLPGQFQDIHYPDKLRLVSSLLETQNDINLGLVKTCVKP